MLVFTNNYHRTAIQFCVINKDEANESNIKIRITELIRA